MLVDHSRESKERAREVVQLFFAKFCPFQLTLEPLRQHLRWTLNQFECL
jgi:hypothetical protein